MLPSAAPRVSAASSAQRHAVLLVQKPHESIMVFVGTDAGINDEMEVVGAGGRLLVVKSISVSSD